MNSLIWEHSSFPDQGYEEWKCDLGQLYDENLAGQFVMSHFFVKVSTNSPGLYYIKIYSGGTISYSCCKSFYTIDEALNFGLHCVARFLVNGASKIFALMDRNYVIEGK